MAPEAVMQLPLCLPCRLLPSPPEAGLRAPGQAGQPGLPC